MTRTRYRIFDTNYPHFLTCTIAGWLPIFTRPETTDIIYDSWAFLQRERDFRLFGYVILENHLHLLASAPELPDVMQSFKSYTAKQIIEVLQRRSVVTILRQLRSLKLSHKTESTYQVWQEGSHPQQIENETMMWQKLEYIHNNPLARGYVDDPLDWRHSSARNYAGRPGLIDVITDWR
jgi:REP element-mobilizing transposase RayT